MSLQFTLYNYKLQQGPYKKNMLNQAQVGVLSVFVRPLVDTMDNEPPAKTVDHR